MAMKVRVLVVSAVLLSTMWVTGCGGHYTCGTTFGNASCTPSGGGISGGGGNNGNNIGVTSFVYFMNDTAQQIAVEGLNVANSENFLPDSNFVSPAFPANLGNDGGVVIVNKQYLYIPFQNGPVYGFSIDATTGDLTPVPNSGSILVPGTGTTVAADPSGNVLFVGGSAGITAFTINPNDGSLTAIGTVTASNPTQLATDGAGLYLYALTGSTITAFSYTASGAMTPVTGSPFTFTPGMAQIAGESTGKFLFGITGQTGGGSGLIDKNIYVFSIAAGGGLTVFGSPVPTQGAPGYLAVHPNGKFVYTFDQTSDAAGSVNDPMEGFAFSTGVLTELSGVSPFTGLDAQLGKFDQSGEYIFAAADVPNSSLSGMFAYGVSSSGALSSTLSHAGVASLSFAVTDEP